jgi:putative holliday junction resolvase
MRWLGVDLGTTRVGIAISDELGMLAHPFKTLNSADLLPALKAIVKEKGITGIVLGMPRNLNGTFGPAAEKARQVAAQLKNELPDLQVVTWDERMTTVEAQRLLHAAGRNVKKSRPIIDQVAAQVLLQSFLDSLQFSEGLGPEQNSR